MTSNRSTYLVTSGSVPHLLLRAEEYLKLFGPKAFYDIVVSITVYMAMPAIKRLEDKAKKYHSMPELLERVLSTCEALSELEEVDMEGESWNAGHALQIPP